MQDILNKIYQDRRENDLIQARIGIRTNGDLHLGNIFLIVVAVLIGKELISHGYKYKLTVILVDQEINGDDLPFKCLKYTRAETLADHSIGIIKKFISELVPKDNSFVVEYQKVSESQKTELFRKLLIKILENSTETIPIYTFCKQCEKLLKAYKKNGDRLIYYCDQCNSYYDLNLENLDEEIMLDHDLLGAIENNLFKIDLHILGADHNINENGGTRMEKREKYQKIINSRSNYLILLTSLLLLKNKKMSKSKKYGIFLSEIKSVFKDSYLEKILNFVLMNNSKTELRINDIEDI